MKKYLLICIYFNLLSQKVNYFLLTKNTQNIINIIPENKNKEFCRMGIIKYQIFKPDTDGNINV